MESFTNHQGAFTALLLLAGGLVLASSPAMAQTGYHYDYDYPGQGDDWYGRTGSPDPRRDYDPFPLDLVSAGFDFGAGYDYGTDILDKLAPLSLTQSRHSTYAFRFGSLGFFPSFITGRVPDGDFTPGPQLVLEKLPSGDIRFDWGPSCGAADVEYEIYRGWMPDFTRHWPLHCSTGGDTFFTITPSGGSAYYLVVPSNTVREGSYGRAASGERPSGVMTCRAPEPAQCG